MNHLKKLPVKNIVIALVIGAFLAAGMTDIAYPISSPSGGGPRTPYREGVVHYDGSLYQDGVVSSGGTLPGPRDGTTTGPRGSAYEDVLSHPGDLLNNVQNSQSRFLGTFALISLVNFAMLSGFTYIRKKGRANKQS